MRHHHHQGCSIGEHQAPLVSLLPLREGETMVLQGTGSYQLVGQKFHGVPLQVLPHGQNKCPEGMNLQLPAKHHGIHSRGMGKVVGLHPSMPAPHDSIFL